MRSHYKQAMDSFSLSEDARAAIVARLSPAPRRRRVLRPVLATAAALVLLMATTATAAAAGGTFYQLLHSLSPALAQSLIPIQMSDTSQDITMTVEGVRLEDNKLLAALTFHDDAGDRLSPGVDLYDSYRVNAPLRSSLLMGSCSSLGYDPDSGNYSYLISQEAVGDGGAPVDFTGRKFTVSVRELLLTQQVDSVTLAPDWSQASQAPAVMALDDIDSPEPTEPYQVNGYSGLADPPAHVLRPQAGGMELTRGFTLSAIGFVDDTLRLLVRYDLKGPDDHGYLNLVWPDGSTHASRSSVHFRDADGIQYVEQSFSVTPEELEDCTLSGTFVSGGYLLKGNWQVTFTLEEGK